MQALAPSLGVEVHPINVRDAGDIERAIIALARPANGGLIVSGTEALYRDLIIRLAAHDFVTGGGFDVVRP